MPQTAIHDEILGLDAIQLAALRKCDDVCFFHRGSDSYLNAIKRRQVNASDPFATDQVVRVETGTQWDDYSGGGFGTSWPIPSFDAFEMTGNYDDGLWRTIAALLRVGDVLTLHWIRDNQGKDSDIARAGFHHDALQLRVDRGDKRLRFAISQRVGPDNSARMIKHVVRANEYTIAA